MTDQEIVDGLINRDEKITDWFFNLKLSSTTHWS